jgi:hypothetical protein
MTLVMDELPNDVANLKRLIVEQRDQLLERNAVIERIREEAARQMEALRQQMEAEHKAAMADLLRCYNRPKSGGRAGSTPSRCLEGQ